MKIKSELFSFKRGIAQGNSVGLINKQLACSAEFVVSLPNTFQNLTPNRNHGK